MRLVLAILVSFAFHALAHADVQAAITQYNQASSNGSDIERISAAKALGAAVMADPSDADASLLAHEAAWTLCRLGSCEDAKPIAAFALTLPEIEGGVNMPQRQLLSSYADWDVKDTSRTRKALDAALEVTKSTPPTALSLTAHKARVTRDTLKSDWRSQRKTATSAAEHMSPIKDFAGPLWAEFSQTSISAGFNHFPDIDHLYQQAHLEGELRSMYKNYEDSSLKLQQMTDAYWRASTWRMAMEAYFGSGGSRKKPNPGQVDEILSSYGIAKPTPYDTTEPDTVDEEGVSKLPFCPGKFNMEPKLKYPKRASRKGMVGAVIARIDVKGSKVETVEILGSVPDEGFKAAAAETVSQWRWIITDSQPGITCRADRKDIILPMAFQMK